MESTLMCVIAVPSTSLTGFRVDNSFTRWFGFKCSPPPDGIRVTEVVDALVPVNGILPINMLHRQIYLGLKINRKLLGGRG